MKQSLSKKLCFVGMSLIGAFVLLNIVLAYFFLIPLSTFRSRLQMEDIMEDIESRIEYTDESFGDYITQITEEMDVWVTVADREKKIIHATRDSELEKKYLGVYTGSIFDENYDSLERGKTVFYARAKESNKGIITIKVMKKIADNRYLILSRSYRSLEEAAISAIIFDALVGVVFIFVGFFVVWRLSRHVVEPVENMKNVAEHIARLEFDMRVDIQTEDEIGQLGHSINTMSEQLESSLHLLQKDIENRKKLVRNLSHEMKAPLAVIMGYADRLKEVIFHDPQKALKYSEIISNESMRADILVKEMLEFSKLERQTEELRRESFLVKELFDDIGKRFEEEYMEDSIEYLEVYDEKEELVADYLMLERAVYNLLRNAVTYGMAESMVIRISGKRNGGYYEIRVYNSGSRIKEEDQTTIWEAFSKVDKARTRGKQGSGIGLSIVREIVEAHDGYYTVENVEDGVEFLISVKG
ncbi:MAG: HAMP domain-containing histidine kinase [Bacteroidales bacterium]|nr:HAMP domain-containing histidine kinase [Clostridium sp.]MCM1202623.1 HAMP domain-containing histidine kinase [Bacteroidales bacterium]